MSGGYLGFPQNYTVFQGIGVDLAKPLTTMCYIGNASSVLAMSAYLCGKEDVANYYVSIINQPSQTFFLRDNNNQ